MAAWQQHGASRQPQKRARRETARRAGAAFRREARSLRYLLSTRLFAAGLIAALIYTVVLASLDPAALGRWLDAWQPVIDTVAAVVPSVRYVGADLAARGFAARGAYVGHIVAMQWLIPAVFTLPAALLLLPEGTRLRRGFAAARAERAARPVPQKPWAKPVLGVLAVAIALYAPLHGASHDTGRYAYDLAHDWLGLFRPYLLLTAAWWVAAYYLWVHAVALVAADTADA